jgi:hypothetical protein
LLDPLLRFRLETVVEKAEAEVVVVVAVVVEPHVDLQVHLVKYMMVMERMVMEMMVMERMVMKSRIVLPPRCCLMKFVCLKVVEVVVVVVGEEVEMEWRVVEKFQGSMWLVGCGGTSLFCFRQTLGYNRDRMVE